MVRENNDGTRTPLTLPNHKKIKASTLRSIALLVKVRTTQSQSSLLSLLSLRSLRPLRLKKIVLT